MPELKRYAIASGVAGLLFIALTLAVWQLPWVSQGDLLMSQWLQQLRSSELDQLMLAVTLIGDVRVLTIISVVMLLCLLYAKKWWLSCHLLSVILSGLVSMQILKNLLERVRPNHLGFNSFSFPSGHTTMSTIILGLVVVLVANNYSKKDRLPVYLAASIVVIIIAFSRVYLLAHWPTDVVAGLALGFSLVLAFSWQLHITPYFEFRQISHILVAVCIITIVTYWGLSFSNSVGIYKVGSL